MNSKRFKRSAVGFLSLVIACGSASAGLLTVGPDYHSPTNAVPEKYKAMELGSWKEGTPLDKVAKGNWWESFKDDELDRLETQSTHENQNLRAAMARVNQARATARVARGELLPSLNLGPSWTRQRFSPNQVPSFGIPERRSQ